MGGIANHRRTACIRAGALPSALNALCTANNGSPIGRSRRCRSLLVLSNNGFGHPTSPAATRRIRPTLVIDGCSTGSGIKTSRPETTSPTCSPSVMVFPQNCIRRRTLTCRLEPITLFFNRFDRRTIEGASITRGLTAVRAMRTTRHRSRARVSRQRPVGSPLRNLSTARSDLDRAPGRPD